MLKSIKEKSQTAILQLFIKKALLCCVLVMLYASCSSLKKTIGPTFTSPFYQPQFTGFLLVDPIAKDTLYSLNSAKYFTPASNVKIFTLYTGTKLLPQKMPALKYALENDTLYAEGTGDPSLLNPNIMDSTALHFLRGFKNIVVNTHNLEGDKFMPGWAWEDYPYYFSPERTAFPLYRNVVKVVVQGDSLHIAPSYFKSKVLVRENHPRRKLDRNEFFVSKQGNDTLQIPFLTHDSLTLRLLGDALGKTVLPSGRTPKEKKTLFGMPTDSLYKQMLWDSDNFTAEQLMLTASTTLSDTLSFTKARNYMLENHLSKMRQQPRWVDGSGLSRYNLFSPESFVFVLDRLKKEIDQGRLFALFPAWDASGTVLQPKPDQNYFIYAKSGSVGNNYNLSGYLRTKKGRVLLFSFMNNHFTRSPREIKLQIYRILNAVHNTY